MPQKKVKQRQNKMRKTIARIFISAAVCIMCSSVSFAQTAAKKTPAVTAVQARDGAVKQSTVLDSIDYLKKQIANAATLADKRSILFFTGTLQEQLGLYSDASLSYAQAAGIGAGDADGMTKVSSEQLVLDAVRASLCAGDFETADNYLNSAVRSSKDEKVLAYINLYAQWSALCKAESIDDTKDCVALLKAYSGMDSMKSVQPALLLTLWYVTGDDSYSAQIKKNFPASPEVALVTGKIQIMSVPFWYFVPHAGQQVEAPANVAIDQPKAEPDKQTESNTSADASAKSASTQTQTQTQTEDGKITREQCGLFRSEDNAKSLVEKLKTKGFAAKITTEKRASGTTYYIVVVDENKDGTIGLKLRDAGFECYPVVE